MNFIFVNDDITYNLEEENGVIAVRPTFTAPRKTKEFIEVLGKSNLLTKDLGAYESREITVPITFLKYNIDKFNLFKLEGMRGKLYFPNYFENTYFEVENISDIEIDDNYEIGEASISFTCNPFRKTDEKEIKIVNNQNFYIYGTVDTKPVFEIKATGDVSFSINGEAISIKNIEDSIILDFERMEFYKKNSNGTLEQQGYKIMSLNLTKIKLLVNKANTVTGLSSNIKEFKIKYKENYI